MKDIPALPPQLCGRGEAIHSCLERSVVQRCGAHEDASRLGGAREPDLPQDQEEEDGGDSSAR